MKYWHTVFCPMTRKRPFPIFVRFPAFQGKTGVSLRFALNRMKWLSATEAVEGSYGPVGGIGYEIIQPLDDKSYHGNS
jgi:hypothetical protein